MLDPSGRRTLMPCVTGVTLSHGLFSRRKWPVQPASAIALCLVCVLEGGVRLALWHWLLTRCFILLGVAAGAVFVDPVCHLEISSLP